MSSRDLSTKTGPKGSETVLEGRRVLIVEDSPVVGPFTADMLADLGCEVIGPAPNMAAAREMVVAGGFDAALMDVHIRGDLVFPLCEILASKDVPFILTSGYADWQSAEKWRDRPRLQKPYTIEQVEKALTELLAPDFRRLEAAPSRSCRCRAYLDFDRTLVTLDDVLDDRKSKTGAPGFAASSSVDTIETLGHAGEVLARDARAVIGHRDSDSSSFGGKSDLDRGIRLVAAIAQRIANEIIDHLNKLRTVAPHWRKIVRGVDPQSRWLLARCAHRGKAGSDHFRQRHPLQRRDETVRLDSREAHQVLNDAEHAPGFVADDPPEAGPSLRGKVVFLG